MEKLLATIPETGAAIGCGRTYLYQLIKENKLETVRAGKRRLVVVELVEGLCRLPARSGVGR